MHRSLSAVASLVLALAVTAGPQTVSAQSASALPSPAAAPAASAEPAASGAPAAAAAPAAPAAPAASDQTAAPAPAASERPATGVRHEAFVIGDYLVSPRVYNAASSGHSGRSSYDLRFAQEFKVQEMPFMIEFDTHDYDYNHFASGTGVCPGVGCITQIGRMSQRYIKSEIERDTDIDGRVGFRIAKPRIYAVLSYLGRESSFNVPTLAGIGIGFEKLPDYEKQISFYASGYYFPSLSGRFTVRNRTTGTSQIFTLTEQDLRYQAGIVISPGKNSPYYIDLGLIGDGVHGEDADPSSSSHFSGYAGLAFFAN